MDNLFLRRCLQQHPGVSNVLDIGCGMCSNLEATKAIFPKANLYGVDISDTLSIPAGIRFCKVDIESQPLPFSDSCFDFIILTHVLEHLKSASLLASEIERTLKEGGSVYAESPNWTSMFVPSFNANRYMHGPFNFFDDNTHIRPWTKQSIFEFLHSCGLEAIKVRTVRRWSRFLLSPFLAPLYLLTKNRAKAIGVIWNLVGWSIYGTGKKMKRVCRT